MARRKSKAKPRSRTIPKINLLNIAESALIANAVTTGMFNTNIAEFFTGNTGAKYGYGADGASTMSLPELLGIGKDVAFGGNHGPGGSLSKSLKQNLMTNGAMMAVSLIAIPVGFRVMSKLTSKPRSSANRLLKMTGLGVKV
jgi:hypothetical protein